MPDGALTITLAEDTLATLAARAETLGVTSQQLAVLLVEEQLAESWTWVGDDPGLTPSAPPGADDLAYELNDVMDEFDAELERRLAAQS